MADRADLRSRLERRLGQLEDRTRRIESDLRRPGDPDWPERAIQRANDEVLERLGDAELSEIARIRAALARLDAGSYGRCGSCGESIDAARLEALPVTDLCVACAADARSA